MITKSEISDYGVSAIKSITAAYSMPQEDGIILADLTAAGFQVTLPDAVKNVGKTYRIKKIDSSGNTLTVGTLNSQTIDGASTATTTTQWATISVMSDGTNWQTITSAASATFTGGTITGATTVNVSSATAFVVGPNGTTNPTLSVITNTASAATGLSITSKAAGSGILLSVLSSGSNENLILTPKGTGGVNVIPASNGNCFTIYKADGSSIVFQASSSAPQVAFGTGVNVTSISGALTFQSYLDSTSAFLFKNNSLANTILSMDSSNTRVGIGKATPSTTLDVAGIITAASATATPAGGSTAARILLGTTANLGIYYGSGAPTVSAAQGSLYIRSDGSSTSTRLYVNTDGATTWTNVTTAA